ncbi:unnamed protein product [Arctogadus glacialis]
MSAHDGVGCRSLRCGKGRQAVGNGGECGEGFGYDIVSERLHAPQPASGSPEEVFSPWKPGPRWDDNKVFTVTEPTLHVYIGTNLVHVSSQH